jgi:hypothetical protein
VAKEFDFAMVELGFVQVCQDLMTAELISAIAVLIENLLHREEFSY